MTASYGYVLRVADEDRDTVWFERAVAEGRELLEAGRPDQAVLMARDLVDEEPLRESAWDLLMRSLWLLGRSAEALQQYDLASRVLHAELGVDPGPALRGLRQAIQQYDAPAPEERTASRVRVVC